MNMKFKALIASAVLTFGAHAGVRVTSVDLTTNGSTGAVNVILDGRSRELPDLKVHGNTIEITLSEAVPFTSFTKNIRGAQISANLLNGKAIVRATLPYAINADSVNLSWRSNGIEVVFPRGGARVAVTPEAAPVPVAPKAAVVAKVEAPTLTDKMEAKSKTKVSKDTLNEDYLNNLMKEEKKKDAPTAQAKDEVRIQQAVQVKAEAPEANVLNNKATNNFSFAGYAAKFTVFLALVLGLFYGIVQLLKKGVFKKGKLGFLNNSQMIEVLSTTYVAPKKSLMIVRAHKQLFLVANSETGLQFLSEMKDTTGLIKEGEKLVLGTNFDTNLNFMETATGEDEPAIKLKENIMESTPVEEKKSITELTTKDIVKFSDELKKKAKKLRPIEFN